MFSLSSKDSILNPTILNMLSCLQNALYLTNTNIPTDFFKQLRIGI